VSSSWSWPPDAVAVDQILAGHRLPINFDALKGYYTAKWGGCPPESVETLDRPWGDKPIGYWEPVTREDLIDRYGIGRP
jgi:hypothetical protein